MARAIPRASSRRSRSTNTLASRSRNVRKPELGALTHQTIPASSSTAPISSACSGVQAHRCTVFTPAGTSQIRRIRRPYRACAGERSASSRAALRLDPLPLRVVHRLEREGDGVTPPDDVGLPGSAQQEPIGDVLVAFDHGEADRPAERVPVRAVADLADVLAVAVELFVAVEQGFRVTDQYLRHPCGPDARVALFDERLLADEPARLVPRDREVDPGVDERVAVVDVDPVVAIRLLQAKRVQG